MTRPRPVAPPAPTLVAPTPGSKASGDWGAAPRKSGTNAVVRFGLVISLAAAGGLGYLVYDKLNKSGTPTAATEPDAKTNADDDKDGEGKDSNIAKGDGKEPERMNPAESNDGVEDLFGGSAGIDDSDTATTASGTSGGGLAGGKSASLSDPTAEGDADLDMDLIAPAKPTSGTKPPLKAAGVPLDVSMDETAEDDPKEDNTIERSPKITPAKQLTKTASRLNDQSFETEEDEETPPSTTQQNRTGAPKKGDKRLEGWEIDELRAAAEAAQAAASAEGITAAQSATAGSVTRVSAPVVGDIAPVSGATLDEEEAVPLSGPGSEEFDLADESLRSTNRPVLQPARGQSPLNDSEFEDPTPSSASEFAERSIPTTVNGIDNSAYRAAASTKVRAAAAARPKLEISNGGEYVIQPGDSYWKISKKVYGSVRYFNALEKFNAANIADATTMRPGMRILTPSPEELESAFPALIEKRSEQPVDAGGYVAAVDAGGRRRLASVEPVSGGFRTEASRVDATSSAAIGVTDDGTYRVGENDSFWSISKQVYGTVRYFRALEKHNSKIIADPAAMRPGVVVHTPTAEELERAYPDLIEKRPANMTATAAHTAAPVASASSGRRRLSAVEPVAPHTHAESTRSTQKSGYFEDESGRPMYRVGSDDTLTGISQQFLGRASRWSELYELNRDRMKDENTLVPGTVLRLPVDAGGAAFESDAEPH